MPGARLPCAKRPAGSVSNSCPAVARESDTARYLSVFLYRRKCQAHPQSAEKSHRRAIAPFLFGSSSCRVKRFARQNQTPRSTPPSLFHAAFSCKSFHLISPILLLSTPPIPRKACHLQPLVSRQTDANASFAIEKRRAHGRLSSFSAFFQKKVRLFSSLMFLCSRPPQKYDIPRRPAFCASCIAVTDNCMAARYGKSDLSPPFSHAIPPSRQIFRRLLPHVLCRIRSMRLSHLFVPQRTRRIENGKEARAACPIPLPPRLLGRSICLIFTRNPAPCARTFRPLEPCLSSFLPLGAIAKPHPSAPLSLHSRQKCKNPLQKLQKTGILHKGSRDRHMASFVRSCAARVSIPQKEPLS